ncbi:MAG: TIGR00730 family Rossman fold protein [Betaproteobacteria bacterium]|nr:TIGR00730 family Rossman fold protein [Betaproteobacteria bacterium]
MKPAPAPRPIRAEKAYHNRSFLNSTDARPLRILAEYIEPKARFDRHEIEDTIVFMGSARVCSREQAEAAVLAAKGDRTALRAARQQLAMSHYYEEARELARRLTEWSKSLESAGRRFVVCTGGGPGIMEAANRGASEARGLNVGLNISLPTEQAGNPYITRELSLNFHYFFMRKFWFAYLAKALLLFPGGFGTLDEMFEVLTLRQTHKMKKPLPIVLFGTGFWDEVIDFEALVRYGTIRPEDLQVFHRTDSVDDAYDYVTRRLAEHALAAPGPTL